VSSLRSWTLPAVASVLAFGLYLRTLAPGLLLNDSAEFQTLVYTLGMTHPTGYPVYLLAGRLFTLFARGDLAWWVNLYSAFLGALTVGLITRQAQHAGAHPLAALAVGLATAAAPLFWWQAVIAEVYTAASLMVAVIISLLLGWQVSRRLSYLALAGLAGGLSVGIHLMVPLLAPGVLLFMLACHARPREWVHAVLGAAAGLLLTVGGFWLIDRVDSPTSYVHTTFSHGISAWGLTSEQAQSFLERLKFFLTTPQFRAVMYGDPVRVMPEAWRAYWHGLLTNFSPAFLTLASLGALGGLARPATRRAAALLALGWASLTYFVLNYQIGQTNELIAFYVPTYALLGLTAGLGAALAAAAADGIARRTFRSAFMRRGFTAAVALGLAVAMLSPQSGRIRDSWQAGKLTFLKPLGYPSESPYPVDRPHYPRERAKALVGHLPANALVFASWDDLYAFQHVAYLEERLHGMSFREIWVQTADKVEDSTLAYIDASLADRPVYTAFEPNRQLQAHYRVEPLSALPWVYRIKERKP
jgi:Protein O-mannosyl-transferase TMEM260-like